MGAEFLRKLLRPSAPVPPSVAEAQAELNRLAAGRPALSAPAALLRDLLPGLVPREPGPPPLPADRARARRAGGVPLLRGETLSLDRQAFRARWLDVCAAVGRHQDGAAARKLAAAQRR